ncbi:MAG: hypothetical protein PHE08_11350 [Bacteroidales bacterium]|nr:hypothetical protein [Bacteroidales bacterium]
MKMLMALLLAILLAANLIPALAQTSQEAPPVGITATLPAELKEAFTSTRSAAFPVTQDVVSIDGGVFTITTNGITAEFMLPFGWMGFTQDIKLQLMDYANFFNDPRSIAQFLIDGGINLLVEDPDSGAFVFVFVYRNSLSELFINLEDEEMFLTALSMYQEDTGLGYKREAANIAGLNFIRSLEPDSEGTLLIYFTYHEGAVIGFQLAIMGKEATPEEEMILAAVIEGTTLQ